ncbi:hypothetical protein CSC70_05635 [Pseudoxanthomonas kalamensis DSM 18571]|uniref:vWA domain-containing protein n=1 Tax=Pseudoxanthomonas kalamensis TaxID=289483 RepID=UPI00139108A8|nr:VWA domain-containing protein [Pseudoxanthomonas kalamensis]KAF1711389.1 hypothetical protein CSC70_05635 [Pseudoxanthomonas kalamensis DSM 18571]
MSVWWDALHFLRLHWLWALLALPVIWLWARRRAQRAAVWRESVDAHLLPHLLDDGGKPGRNGPWLASVCIVLAVLALAGPSWRQSEQPLWQARSPLVIAVDLSSRISANDLPPSRLAQVRAKLSHLLRAREGGQVALVAYSGEPYTVAPLTDDAGNVALFLDALDPDVMPVDGQDPAAAIAWSQRLLQQAGFEHGDILLLTDQANAAAQAAAVEAWQQGTRVSVLGIGTPTGSAYRARAGAIEQARLDTGSLQALATAGGGRYRTLTADDADLQALDVLQPREAASTARGQGGLAWQDEGYWLLLPLLLLALPLFRRGGMTVLALCVLLPLALPAQAAEGGWWRRADQVQHGRLVEGARAYREGDYAAAQQQFEGIDTADGYYNLGNALAKQGHYDPAIAAYDEALKRQPDMEDAKANRAAVQAARKQQSEQNPDAQPQSGQDGKQGRQGQAGGKQQDSSSKPQPGQKPETSGSSPSQQEQDPSTQSRQQTPESADRKPQSESSAKAQDAQSQQQADAAQRERMRQAMTDEEGKPQQAQAVVEADNETAEQREQRQAVDAWLRRVPDDPGGLLREKFRLEHERRRREGR